MERLRKRTLLFPIVLLALLIAYAYQDVSTSSQGGMGVMNRSMVHVLLFSIIGFLGFYVISHHWEGYSLKTLLRPLICWEIYIFFSMWINAIPLNVAVIYPMFVLWWILSLITFSTYTYRNYANFKQIRNLFLIMFGVWIWLSLVARAGMIAKGNVFGTSMFIYNLLLLTPTIFFIKGKKLRYILLLVAFFMCILSFKRGAIVTLPVMVLAYILTKGKIHNKQFKNIWLLIVAFGIFAVIINYIDGLYDGLLLSRFTSEELATGSGRDHLREMALSAIDKRDTLTYFFGTGPGTTVSYLGTGAHNEWIEAMFCYGIVGICLYLWMVLSGARFAYKLIKMRSEYAPQASMYVTYLIMCSMFSGFLFMHIAFYYWAGMGVLSGLVKHGKRKLNVAG